MTRRCTHRNVMIAAIAGLMTLASCRRESVRIEVLTTPAVAATGLPQRLTAEFNRETGVPVDFRILTAEQIENRAMRSPAIAIFRDADLDATLERQQSVRLRSVFATEDFLILGPRRDPARIRGFTSAAEAFRRIAARRRAFCAPVDVPSLRDVENEVWSAARVDPHRNSRYRECKGDAKEVLERSDMTEAYTISDRTTAESTETRRLEVLLRDVPILHHEYIVALVRPPSVKASRNVAWFAEWVMSYRGRDIVRSIRERHQGAFYVPGEG